ncbi:MAG TPA: PIN domain-containing protein, partial [Chloroflexota bacterium]|nr:PIN domain-containing protein [Chloroflexota bacterium]
ITEHAWGETVHELEKRVASIERTGRLAPDLAQALQTDALNAAVQHLAQHLLAVFAHLERTAHRRIPRDPDDWPTVALALALDAGIWTQDADFLGCGLPTWTTDTLLAYLEDEPAGSQPAATS